MKRKELFLMESNEPEEYSRAYRAMLEFTELHPETSVKIGFSANAGEFGGFVTDDETTWNTWAESNQ